MADKPIYDPNLVPPEQGQSIDPQLEEEYSQEEKAQAILEAGGQLDPESPFVLKLVENLLAPKGSPALLGPPMTPEEASELYQMQRHQEGLPPIEGPEPDPPLAQIRHEMDPSRRTMYQPQAAPPAAPGAPGAQPFTLPRLGGGPSTRKVSEAARYIEGVGGEHKKAVEGYVGRLRSVLSAQQGARQETAETISQVAEEQAAILKSGMDAVAIVQDDFATRLNTAREESKMALQGYQDALREQMEMEPIESWGLGRKIGAGIAMALGAVGSAYTGQSNQAMAIIKMGIEREAQEYKQRMAQRGLKTALEKNLYTIAKEHYTDTESQMAAAKAAQWDVVAKQLALGAAKSKSPIIQMKAKETIAEAEANKERELSTLEQKQVKDKMILGQAALGGAVSEFQAKATKEAASIQKAGLGLKRAEGIRATQAKVREEKEKLEIPGLQRVQGTIPSKTQKEYVAKMKGGHDVLNSHLTDLENWRKEHSGFKKIPDSALTKAEMIITRAVKAAVNVDMAGAALSEFESSLTGLVDGGVIADPGQFGFMLARIQELKRLGLKEFTKKINPIGYILPRAEYRKKGQRIDKVQ